MRHACRSLALCPALLPGAARAEAALVAFVIRAPGATYSFILPQSPVPDDLDPTCFLLVPVQVQGIGTANISFFADVFGGGLNIGTDTQPDVYGTGGAQYFTGSLATPSFVAGVFPGQDGASIEITVLSAIAEPATAGLVGAGLLGLLAPGRRRRAVSPPPPPP